MNHENDFHSPVRRSKAVLFAIAFAAAIVILYLGPGSIGVAQIVINTPDPTPEPTRGVDDYYWGVDTDKDDGLSRFDDHYPEVAPHFFVGKIGCGACLPDDIECEFNETKKVDECTCNNSGCNNRIETDELGTSAIDVFSDARRNFVYWHLSGYGPDVEESWIDEYIQSSSVPPAEKAFCMRTAYTRYPGPEDVDKRVAYQYGCTQAFAFLETYYLYYDGDFGDGYFGGNTLFVDLENPISGKEDYCWGASPILEPQRQRNQAVLEGYLEGMRIGLMERDKDDKQIGIYTAPSKWREIIGEDYVLSHPVVLWMARYRYNSWPNDWPDLQEDVVNHDWFPWMFDGTKFGIYTSLVGGYLPVIWQFSKDPFDMDVAVQDPVQGFTPRTASNLVVHTIEIPIRERSDDAGDFQNTYSACDYSIAAEEIHFGQCYNSQIITSGFRFTNVDIPQGAEIMSAYIRFRAVDCPYMTELQLSLYGEYTAHAETFSDESQPADRSLTGSAVTWNIAAGDIWQAGQWRYSPDISRIIQEIVDRRVLIAPYPTLEEWSSGNALAIIVKGEGGTGYRGVVSYENSKAGPPATLVVTYRKYSVTETKANVEVRAGKGSCPALSCGLEVTGMDSRSQYFYQLINPSSGQYLTDRIAIEGDQSGEASIWPLFTIPSGSSSNVVVQVIEVEKTGVEKLVLSRWMNTCNTCMGNDHMDDNLSASSYSAAAAQSGPLSDGTSKPRVAVLSSGFFWGAEDFSALAGEPADWINLDFDPVAVAWKYPVLVIPSGGLYGMENSPFFRARLEEYARLGGTIVAFTQQHGCEFGILPGGEVGGYGWVEDLSCSGASLFMETWHPILSGFSSADVHAHVDGYFTSYPEDTQVILSRKANGRPAAILYPYGEGCVFVTTMYDDWGTGHGQSYQDARTLFRDLVTWAAAPGEVLEFEPGDPVTFDLTVRNNGTVDATGVEINLIDPARRLNMASSSIITIPAGGVATVPFTTTAATPPGLWCIEAAPLDQDVFPTAPLKQVACFAVAQPPAIVDPEKPLYLSITSPYNAYIRGTEAEFTYHVYNYSDNALVADVYYGVNHNYNWEDGRYPLAEDVVVPAAENGEPGEVAIPLHQLVPIRNMMMRGCVVSGEHHDSAAFGINLLHPEDVLHAQVQPEKVERGEEATLQVRILQSGRSGAGPITGTLRIRAVDAARNTYYTAALPLPVGEAGGGDPDWTLTHVVPVDPSVSGGSGKVSVFVDSPEGRTIAGKTLRLDVPLSPVALSFPEPLHQYAESTIRATLALSNTSPSLIVAGGILDVRLITPDGEIVKADPVSIDLSPLSSRVVELTLPVPLLVFGEYTIEAGYSDSYGERLNSQVLSALPAVQGMLVEGSCRAGGVALLDLQLVNPGPFTIPVEASLVSGLPSTQTLAVDLEPHSSNSSLIEVPVPAAAAAGSYPLELTLTSPGGVTLSRQAGIVRIPPSSLELTSPQPDVAAGGNLSLSISNEGGANTTAAYKLSLVDAWGTAVATWSGVESLIAGQSLGISLPVPADAASGFYTLDGSLVDEAADVRHPLVKVLTVQGTEASLVVDTDRPAYLADEVMQLSALIGNGDIPVEDATLTWRVTQAGGGMHPARVPELVLHSLREFGIDSLGTVNEVEIDWDGSLWLATAPDGGQEGGVVALHPDGTGTVYTTANSALSSDNVLDLVAMGGRVWAVTDAGGIDLRDTDGTWEHFTEIGSRALSGRTTAVERAYSYPSGVWIGSNGDGIYRVRQYSYGLRLDQYTVPGDSGCSNVINMLEDDHSGKVWIALPDEGVCLFDGSGGFEAYTPANSGIGAGKVKAIEVTDSGDVWFAHCDAGAAASVRRPDGSWETFGYPGVPGGGVVDCTNAIAVDPGENVWFSFSGDSDVVSVLLADDSGIQTGEWWHYGPGSGFPAGIEVIKADPDGVRWALSGTGEIASFTGRFRDPSLWETYLDEFNGALYYPGIPVLSVAVDTAGNRWFLQQECGEGVWTVISRLSADGSSWDRWSFEGGGCNRTTDMEVDSLGRLWLLDSGDDPEQLLIGSLDGAEWDWQTVTDDPAGGDLPAGRRTFVEDSEGRIWIAGDEGGASVFSDSSVTRYTAANSGLPSNHVFDLAVDPLGNAWFVLGYQYEEQDVVVALRQQDGTWLSFTPGNSPLPSSGNNIRDVAVDRQGNAYFAVGGYDEGPGEYVDEAVLIYRGGNDWSLFTLPELLTEPIRSMAVGHDGRVWLIVGGQDFWYWDPSELVCLSPRTGQFTRATDTPGLEPYSDRVFDMDVDNDGNLWVVWAGRYDIWYNRSVGAVTRYSAVKRILWESSREVSLSGSEQRLELLDVPASDIGAVGLLHLEGELETASGQRLAWGEAPFAIFGEGVPALSLEVAPAAVRAGQPVLISGSVRNTTGIPLEGYVVDVFVNSEDTGRMHGPGIIAVGDTWQYSLTAGAPAVGGTYDVTVSDGISSLTGRLEVVEPRLRASLEGPSVAGREPFDLVLKLTNQTPLPAGIDIDLHGETISLSLPAHESRTLVRTFAIEADTTFDVIISGDVTKQLSHTVSFGEALEVEFVPQTVYAEGVVTVPYTLRNVGQVPLGFVSYVDLKRTGSIVDTISFESYLAVGETGSNELLYDLVPGDYTLSYFTSLTQTDVSFRVAPLVEVDLSGAVGTRQGNTITVTALIGNNGLEPFAGLVRLTTPFFETETPAELSAGGAREITIPIDLSMAPGGMQSATLSLLSASGEVLASTGMVFGVPGADLLLTRTPAGTVVAAGEDIELLFGIRNDGSTSATAEISVTLGEAIDETQSLWLEGGGEGTISFRFTAPEGLAVDSIVGEFRFEGERFDLTLPAAGVALEVAAQFDQPAYAVGETANLQLLITNTGTRPAPEMYVHVAYAGEVIRQPVSLESGGSEMFYFPLVAREGADQKVFYAVYEAGQDLGVLLNTTYLRLLEPDVTIVLDSHSYKPGDAVSATIVTAATGELVVSGPGISETIQLPSAGFQFTLPGDLQRGTRWLDYGLRGGAIHQVVFDVDAPWVRVTEARLHGLPYEPGGQVEVDLTIASTDMLDIGVRACLVGPDMTRGEALSTITSLEAVLNNRVDLTLPLTTDLAGRFQLVYALTVPGDPGHVYATGSKSFDVGVASILALRGNEPGYPGSEDPVQVEVSLYASKSSEGILTLLVDGDKVFSGTLVMPGGSQTVLIDLPGPLAPGWHMVAAGIEVGGLTALAQFDLAYGTDAADLAMVSLDMIGSSGQTRTLRARVENRGKEVSAATTAGIWDGAAGDGTLLGTVQLPELEPAERFDAELVWDVVNQAGVHTIIVVIDPDDLVAEFHEANNTAEETVFVPPFDVQLETDSDSYSAGQAVTLLLSMMNLGSVTEALAVTVDAWDTQGGAQLIDERLLILPPGGPVHEVIVWQTSGLPEGPYSVYVTVENDGGDRAWASAGIVVTPAVPPLVEAGADMAGLEGSPVAFAGAVDGSDTPGDHQIAWDFGDGTVEAGMLTMTHIYGDDGVYTVTLTVTDTTGLTGTDSLQLVVSNAAPSVDAGSDKTVDVGQEVAFQGVFSDPGTADTHSIFWEFGDGAVTSGTLNPVHVYASAGTYTATFSVTDDDGGVGSDTVLVVVRPKIERVGIDRWLILWRNGNVSQFKFVLKGDLELPRGYYPGDLSGDLGIYLTVGGQTAFKMFSLIKLGRIWYYYGGSPASRLNTVLIIWPPAGGGGSATIILGGVYSLEGVDSGTRPAQVELQLRLPLKKQPELEWISTYATIEFYTYGQIWWYSRYYLSGLRKDLYGTRGRQKKYSWTTPSRGFPYCRNTRDFTIPGDKTSSIPKICY